MPEMKRWTRKMISVDPRNIRVGDEFTLKDGKVLAYRWTN